MNIIAYRISETWYSDNIKAIRHIILGLFETWSDAKDYVDNYKIICRKRIPDAYFNQGDDEDYINEGDRLVSVERTYTEKEGDLVQIDKYYIEEFKNNLQMPITLQKTF